MVEKRQDSLGYLSVVLDAITLASPLEQPSRKVKHIGLRLLHLLQCWNAGDWHMAYRQLLQISLLTHTHAHRKASSVLFWCAPSLHSRSPRSASRHGIIDGRPHSTTRTGHRQSIHASSGTLHTSCRCCANSIMPLGRLNATSCANVQCSQTNRCTNVPVFWQRISKKRTRTVRTLRQRVG